MSTTVSGLMVNDRIEKLESQIEGLKKQLLEERKKLPPQSVADYAFFQTDGAEVGLSELFHGKPDLLAIHNMGSRCAYCTLWADGFAGLYPHLRTRTAFVLVSADEPNKAKEFSESRGWPFPVVSGRASSFTRDMGFEPNPGEFWPGVSAFRRNGDGTIERIANAFFGPGDDFCALWPMIDLLAEGQNDWSPKIAY